MADDAAKLLDVLRGMATGDAGAVIDLAESNEENQQVSGLDPKTHSLVRLAALVALGAEQGSYEFSVAVARDNGATPDDILGLLVALMPTVGMPRIIQAAPKMIRAIVD